MDKLHDEKTHPFGFLQVVDRSDSGVVEGSEGLRLSFETREAIPVLCEFFGQDLDRDLASEFAVAGAVDFSHAPYAE